MSDNERLAFYRLKDEEDMTIKCNVGFWIGSRNRKMILVEKMAVQTKSVVQIILGY